MCVCVRFSIPRTSASFSSRLTATTFAVDRVCNRQESKIILFKCGDLFKSEGSPACAVPRATPQRRPSLPSLTSTNTGSSSSGGEFDPPGNDSLHDLSIHSRDSGRSSDYFDGGPFMVSWPWAPLTLHSGSSSPLPVDNKKKKKKRKKKKKKREFIEHFRRPKAKDIKG